MREQKVKGKPRPRLFLTTQTAIRSSSLPNETQLRRWIKAALESGANITLRFVDEKEGRRLNQQFRGKNYATNVLSFSYRNNLDCATLHPGYDIYGDIVICVPIVMREAKAQRKKLEAHYAHLIIHGVLHLQGYIHLKKHDAAIMEKLESEILIKLGYDDPYLGDRE